MNKPKLPASLNFASIDQVDVPRGRNGKHHLVISRILSDLAQLEPGRALKIPISKLNDSKENIRSALNRATRTKGISVCTASDEEFFYVWKDDNSTEADGRKQLASR